ncbi:hypothetical protein [Streptomyces sp. NBC_00859]|uniref:hypothetical protein n=1 Tax=Streptomyces sp. NBC_00859 TaxID=2903682 RepID=UPI00386BE6FB|nr:hypothetical protein OG584_10340 [Streptomyces sp. NBC_00859]
MSENATGVLLLCRAAPAAVRPAAQVLGEQLLLAPAGEGWSVLVPEGKPWLHGEEPVDRVAGGWVTALAVSSPWPVLALWWDCDRSGLTQASGFRRPVGYMWRADGTPVGEDGAMRTFGARLRLDPVLDLQALTELTVPDQLADSRSRLTGLTAVLTGAGLTLPTGLTPGDPADRLREVARIHPAAGRVEPTGLREALRSGLAAFEDGSLGPWLRGPRARALGAAQLAAGLPLALWGFSRRSAGWTTAAALLMAHGVLGLAYDRMRAGA